MKIRTAISFASGMLATLTIAAQTRPMPPDPYDPHQHLAEQSQKDYSTSPAVYPARNDFPSVEVQAVAPARARMVELRWTVDQARRTLHQAVDRLREDFEFSSEMQSALRANLAAHQKFVAARDAVLDELKKDLKYRTLRSMGDDLKKRIETLQAEDPRANADAILANAELRLQYAAQARNIEADALQADARFQDARVRLIDSAQHVQQLRQEFNRDIKRNEEFVTARRTMDNLNVAYLGANTYYVEAVRARDIAMDYAYHLHRFDDHKYRVGYYPNYYGRHYNDSVAYYRSDKYSRYR